MTQRRVNTIRLLVHGSAVESQPEMAAIERELAEIANVGRLQPETRRRLLQVLHVTRTLDTFLSTLLRVHSIPRAADQHSLGAYLTLLVNHTRAGVGRLSERERRRYQDQIVDLRNRYMHEAGAFPSSGNDITVLLNEMYDCIARVSAL